MAVATQEPSVKMAAATHQLSPESEEDQWLIDFWSEPVSPNSAPVPESAPDSAPVPESAPDSAPEPDPFHERCADPPKYTRGRSGQGHGGRAIMAPRAPRPALETSVPVCTSTLTCQGEQKRERGNQHNHNAR
ncbi:hypothetical protein DPX16_21203 [Anabarilius grahami]|uniref:Uncharacterized protein n=1 Tax=Anabarilius grahami TaxID=495550 RepID=A0A3N0Z2T6_ANAGA|nr:hypothetical protein DPX16_21203 [Anabarilius grahami]